MRTFLTKLHRWLGFPLGLLFLITFATGLLTALDELLQRTQPPGFSYRATTSDEQAFALQRIISQHDGIRQIAMPTSSAPYYQVSIADGQYLYAIDNLDNRVYTAREENGFFKTVLQLHRNYLLGKEGLWGIDGKYYAAWVGLLALLLSLIGLWLWWPQLKKFRLRDVIPSGGKRKHFYYAHISGGVVVLVAILLLSLTGASVSYRALTQQLLGVAQEEQRHAPPQPLSDSWQVWLQEAYQQVPGAQLTQIRWPKPSRDGKPRAPVLELRFLAPGDWLGLPNTKVLIDPKASALLSVSYFHQLSFGEKLYAVLVPLHTGRGLHPGYVLLLLTFSALGCLMMVSGLVSFARKKRRRLFASAIAGLFAKT